MSCVAAADSAKIRPRSSSAPLLAASVVMAATKAEEIVPEAFPFRGLQRHRNRAARFHSEFFVPKHSSPLHAPIGLAASVTGARTAGKHYFGTPNLAWLVRSFVLFDGWWCSAMQTGVLQCNRRAKTFERCISGIKRGYGRWLRKDQYRQLKARHNPRDPYDFTARPKAYLLRLTVPAAGRCRLPNLGRWTEPLDEFISPPGISTSRSWRVPSS